MRHGAEALPTPITRRVPLFRRESAPSIPVPERPVRVTRLSEIVAV
jgi:hypothetical protein